MITLHGVTRQRQDISLHADKNTEYTGRLTKVVSGKLRLKLAAEQRMTQAVI